MIRLPFPRFAIAAAPSARRPAAPSARGLAAAALTALTAGALLPQAAAAQEPEFPGVQLGLAYESTYQPALALKPFTGRFGGGATASQVEAIIGRDLRYSDRFVIMDSIPPAMVGGEGVDYGLWDRLGAVWLVSATVEGSGDGYVAVVQLHDVVYASVKERQTFRIPEPDDPGFRMAVHHISDEIVRWVTGERGMAASRVAFSRRNERGGKEIWLIDSDGENLRRVTHYAAEVPEGAAPLALSASWSPDGNRLVYTAVRTADWEIIEKDLRTGNEKVLDIRRDGQLSTPTYAPDGESIAFSVHGGTRSGLYTYNVARGCCLENLTEGPRFDISPTYSPDGRFIAFNSNRLGDAIPQIYFMPAGGGSADLLSPYAYGRQGYYTSPDWSPVGDLVAFHGKIGRVGRYQILVARMGEQGRLTQLTSEGNNEDPSWAPDGRHIVFVGERSWGQGLMVVDAATGTIRTLLRGVEVDVPAWSPSLGGR